MIKMNFIEIMAAYIEYVIDKYDKKEKLLELSMRLNDIIDKINKKLLLEKLAK